EAIPSVLSRPDAAVDCVRELDHAALRRLAERHLEALRGLADKPAERVADKMPDNYIYLGLLAALFPRAAFIHCRRDLRDVAVSCWFTQFQWLEWTNDVDNIAMRFEDYLRLMDHWQKVLPVPLFEVDYEMLVNDLEGTARR